MTPDAWMGLIKDFGLPLVMLGLFAWAIIKRKFVTGAELSDMRTLYERERTDRIAAEQTLAKFGGASVEVAEAVREALSAVVKRPVKRMAEPYTERLEGPPRRGR